MRLSGTRKQRCWLEEIPRVRGKTLFSSRRGWLHSGHLERKGERVDYIIRIDLGLVWLRYQGDSRFTHSWPCAYICSPSYRSKIPRLGCPFCGGMDQLKQTISERRAIQSGDLGVLAENLKGNPFQAYRAMLAMEMEGLRPRQFTVEKREQVWKHRKNRSLK